MCSIGFVIVMRKFILFAVKISMNISCSARARDGDTAGKGAGLWDAVRP
jgi:hypothetical protein